MKLQRLQKSAPKPAPDPPYFPVVGLLVEGWSGSCLGGGSGVGDLKCWVGSVRSFPNWERSYHLQPSALRAHAWTRPPNHEPSAMSHAPSIQKHASNLQHQAPEYHQGIEESRFWDVVGVGVREYPNSNILTVKNRPAQGRQAYAESLCKNKMEFQRDGHVTA